MDEVMVCSRYEDWILCKCIRRFRYPWRKRNMRWCLNLVARSFPQAIVLSDCAPIQTASRQQSPSVLCSVSQVVFGVSWMLLRYNLSNWHPLSCLWACLFPSCRFEVRLALKHEHVGSAAGKHVPLICCVQRTLCWRKSLEGYDYTVWMHLRVRT